MAMAWLQRLKTVQDSSSWVMQSCGQLELPRLSKPENEKAVRRQRWSTRGKQKLTRGPPAITRVIFYNVVSVCYSSSSCVGDGSGTDRESAFALTVTASMNSTIGSRD